MHEGLECFLFLTLGMKLNCLHGYIFTREITPAGARTADPPDPSVKSLMALQLQLPRLVSNFNLSDEIRFFQHDYTFFHSAKKSDESIDAAE